MSLGLSFFFAVLATVLAIILGGVTHYSGERLMKLDSQYAELDALKSKILLYDEILTMSARMASATQDERWQKRYKEFEPRLESAIEELIRRQPEGVSKAEKTDIANKRLVEMEGEAFRLVARGMNQEALKLLDSAEYDMQKQIYSRGMEDLYLNLSESKLNQKTEYQRFVLWLQIVFLFFGLSSGVAWIGMYVHLRKVYRESRSFHERMLTAQENERARISREIHDDVGQKLSGIKIWLAKLKVPDQPEQSTILSEIRKLIESMSESLRVISLSLHPSLVKNLGLPSAIQWNLENAAKAAGWKFEFVSQCSEVIESLPFEKKMHIYRIIQEAIQNIQKHADASIVKIRTFNANGKICLEVVDDGSGIISDKKGIGFFSMSERAENVGASFDVESPLSVESKQRCHLPMETIGTRVKLEWKASDLQLS